MKKLKSLLLLAVIPSFSFLISCAEEKSSKQILEEIALKIKPFINSNKKFEQRVLQKVDFEKKDNNEATLNIALNPDFFSIFSDPRSKLNLEVRITGIKDTQYKRRTDFGDNQVNFEFKDLDPTVDYQVGLIRINDRVIELPTTKSDNFTLEIKASEMKETGENSGTNEGENPPDNPPVDETPDKETPPENTNPQDDLTYKDEQGNKNLKPPTDGDFQNPKIGGDFGLPEGFTFPSVEKGKNADKYPPFASKYKAVDPQVLYKELYDRTFSIKFGVTLNKGVKVYGSPENKFLATENGTAWLLDYHKKDGNNYKLFFATNLHVASHLSNTLDKHLLTKFNYEDPSQDKATSISIGKSAKAPQTFATHNNNYNFSQDPNNVAKFYASDDNFKNANFTDLSALVTTKTNAFTSGPKLIFAGYDFINREYINPFQEELLTKIQNSLESYKNREGSEEEYSEYNILKKTLETKEFIPLYTDFAVFELDVNLSNADETLKDWILKAINALDQYIKRNKENELPNQDKSISTYMQTVDYITASRTSNNQYLTNSKNAYMLGYPGIDGGKSSLAWNNPTERNNDTKPASYWRAPENKNAFAIPGNDNERKMLNFNLNPYPKVFHKTLGDYYGYTQNIRFSSLYFGASGSLVYNEFGQMVGIYSLVQSSGERWDLLKRASFTPFLLSKDVKDTGSNKIIKAYNLIDGSDTQKFPAQTRSYRQNLKEIYPNGFESGNYKTALFPEGFKAISIQR